MQNTAMEHPSRSEEERTESVSQGSEVALKKAPPKASLREWLGVDFSRRVPIELQLASYSDLEQQGDISSSAPLGFGNAMTAGDIQRIYAGSPLTERWLDVFLILKLSLAFMAYGMTTVDAKLIMLKVCENLGLQAEFHFSTSVLELSVGGHSHVLWINVDIVADKLMDVTALARLLASARAAKTRTAVLALNGIIDRPLPYGWLPSILNLWMLFTWAAICAFMGDFQDLAATAMIAPFSVGTMLVCKRFKLGNIELCLVSLIVGIVIPLVWKFIVPVSICSIPRIWGAALLLWLPGTELINGAYEIKYGKLISGASQFMAALIKCAFMGIGLTIGWQVFGRDAALQATNGKTGVVASLVPSHGCGDPFATPVYMIFGVYNFPMLFHCFASLNMRLRDMPYAFLVVYPSLLVYISLVVSGQVPKFVANAIATFLATNLASAVEWWNGTPANLSLVPIMIILAPGQPSVASVLASMQVDNGVSGVHVTEFWSNLALQGVSYAFGMCIALEIWRPILHSRDQVKAQQVASICGWAA